MVPRVVPKVLESKSMMFQVSKTMSTVINEHLDKNLRIIEFWYFFTFCIRTLNANFILWDTTMVPKNILTEKYESSAF